MAVDFNDEGYPIDENGDLVPPNGGDEKGSFWVLSDGSCLSRYPNGYWERTTTKLVGMTLVDNTMKLKAPRQEVTQNGSYLLLEHSSDTCISSAPLTRSRMTRTPKFSGTRLVCQLS